MVTCPTEGVHLQQTSNNCDQRSESHRHQKHFEFVAGGTFVARLAKHLPLRYYAMAPRENVFEKILVVDVDTGYCA